VTPLNDGEFRSLQQHVVLFARYGVPGALSPGQAELLLAECERARANEQALIAKLHFLMVAAEESG
jgi:hypothetical protein